MLRLMLQCWHIITILRVCCSSRAGQLHKTLTLDALTHAASHALQEAPSAAQTQACAAALACHCHSQGHVTAAGQGSCVQPQQAAHETMLAAVEADPCGSSDGAAAPLQQDGVQLTQGEELHTQTGQPRKIFHKVLLFSPFFGRGQVTCWFINPPFTLFACLW